MPNAIRAIMCCTFKGGGVKQSVLAKAGRGDDRTTRSRVNFFMKKFHRLGFIDYSAGLKVNNSQLTVVLHL